MCNVCDFTPPTKEAVYLIENIGAAASGYFHPSLWSPGDHVTYSSRSATMGSTFTSRRAGM